MPEPHRIFHKGQDNDFIVFVDDVELWEKFKTDSSIPLVEIVSVFKVFSTTRGTGAELETASESELENEFGTKDVNEAITKILKEGVDRKGADIRDKELK